MPAFPYLLRGFRPDAEAFLKNLRRQGTPRRVHFMELYQDAEVNEAVAQRFELARGLSPDDPDFQIKKYIATQRFLGYDYCSVYVGGVAFVYNWESTADPASDLKRESRSWMNEHRGPIGSWEDFEKYPWPDPKKIDTSALEKFSRLVPDDMCLVGHSGHFCENLVWLFGYETLCYLLYDDRKLVEAVAQRILAIEDAIFTVYLQFPRVQAIWHSDDLGFKTSLLLSADDMRHFVLSGHKQMAAKVHAAGRLSLLHACGNRAAILEDIISDVKFDALHSFEDTIEKVTDAKQRYGHRISLIGGIDVDFLCRASEPEIRRRVRETLDTCLPGGGYCLGSGNSIANYIPLDNYLTMLDEGRCYGEGK